MKIYDMPQKSEPWFEMRYGKLGGSSIDKLTTPAKFKTVKNELISARLEDFVFDEDEANKFLGKAVARGNELEPFARDYLNELTGLGFKEYGWLQSDIKIFGLSPDGMTENEKSSCEIKCPQASTHTKYILAGYTIPSEYFWQCIAYFAVNPKLEKHWFISYRPECQVEAHIIILERDAFTQFGKSKKTVQEWVDMLLELAKQMDEEVDSAVEEILNRDLF